MCCWSIFGDSGAQITPILIAPQLFHSTDREFGIAPEEKSDLVHRLLSEGCTHLIGKLCEYNRDAKIILDGGSPQLERIVQEQERLATRQFYSILQKVIFRTFSGTCEPWILADAWNVVEGGDTYHRYVTLRKFHGSERDRQEQLYEQHLKALPLDQRLEQRARDAIQLIQWLIAETQQEQAEERQKFSAEDLADLDAQRTHIAQRIEVILREVLKDR